MSRRLWVRLSRTPNLLQHLFVGVPQPGDPSLMFPCIALSYDRSSKRTDIRCVFGCKIFYDIDSRSCIPAWAFGLIET